MQRRKQSLIWDLTVLVGVLALVSGYYRYESSATQAEPSTLVATSSPVRAAEDGTRSSKVGQEAWSKARSLAMEGDQARRAGRLKEAEGYYTEALQFVHWHPIWNNRGWVRCELGKFEAALDDAQRAIDTCDEPDALKHYHHTKATALQGLGRNREALQAVEDSLAFDPGFGHSLKLRQELRQGG